MSAVDRAHEMRGPVETFGGFAHLEIAAIDDERRLATLLAICDEALEESQALLAARPDAPGAPPVSPPPAPGLLAGLLRAAGGGDEARRERQRAEMDAWFERVEALEAATTGRVAAWRAAVDAEWLAGALADRDAALESLVERGAATREMVDIVAEHPFGDLMLRAALAHD
ncbi:hypothetical protein GCM10009846_14860 [Agrococcus versicolor]|uniref:HPt domain-containing protein n=1 Tax=Agrococcus versicolor TaxID=501482 RepID=A0ABN3AR83_9MICO